MIDDYRLEEVLGEGASSVVYAGRTIGGGRVAVKVLRPERTTDAVCRNSTERFRLTAPLSLLSL